MNFHILDGIGDILSYSAVLFEVVILVVLVVVFIKNRRKTIYSYINVGAIGISFFMLFALHTTVGSIIRCNRSGTDLAVGLSDTISTVGLNFCVWLIPVMVILFSALAVSNISLVLHEGYKLKNLLGILLGLFILGVTVFIVLGWNLIEIYFINPLINKGLTWLSVVDYAVPFIVSGFMCYFDCLMFGTIIHGFIAAIHRPAYNKDFAIILGCAINQDGTPQPILRDRTDNAFRFAEKQLNKKGKPLCFVPSGGQGEDECIPEAESVKNYLVLKGVDSKNIFPETESTSTLENMKFSKKIIDDIKPESKIVFSTSNYHVFRSGIYARAVGLDAEGIGCKTKWYFWPNAFVREFIALIVERRTVHRFFLIALSVVGVLLGLVDYYFTFFGG